MLRGRFFWNGVMLKVVGREFLHGGGGANSAIIPDGIVPPESLCQNDPRPLPRLVEADQRAVLSNGLAPGGARLPVTVLNDVVEVASTD